ncbi:MAG TPA: LytTR family DNA-binding domain-containing protein [Cyclobacteriaceae bacterium]
MEKKKILQHLLFWLVIIAFLTYYFGRENEEYIKAFYFAASLLPVVVGTSYFFSYYLIPTFLLPGRYWRFSLYFIYMIIISLYLEMLVVTGSFVVLANYQYNKMLPITVDTISMGITLYLIVLSVAFFRLITILRRDSEEKSNLLNVIARNKTETITIISDRNKVPINVADIIYIESLADYVKIITTKESHITKEKISSLNDKLPTYFLRIHRSFIVNINHIQSYNKERVIIANLELPISRSYKKDVESSLLTSKESA